MCASLLLLSACGTPPTRIDTSICNKPGWTARSPKTLPPTRDGTGGALLENHALVAAEYHSLRKKHEGLATCVEENHVREPLP